MARRSFSAILSAMAQADPDRVLVVDGARRLTAGWLDRWSTRAARMLLDRGVRRNDLVEVRRTNGLEFVLACFAVWKAGATPMPLSPAMAQEEREALERLALPSYSFGPGPLPEVDGYSCAPLPDAWADCWKAPASSGSTGRPKIVQANAPALLDPDRPVAAFLPRGAVQLVSGPMWHSAVFTYAFRGLMTGHRLILLPRFEERAWLDAAEAHAVTWSLVVPAMMHRLMRLPAAERDPRRLDSLETVLHLGAPCAPALKRAFLEWIGPERVIEVYAGSESNGLTMIRGDEWLEHPGSVGRPLGGTEVTVRREDGTAAAPGEHGRIWMRRGGTPAYRYLGARSQRDAEGWDTLGDIGRLDAEGYLHLVDRAGDVIDRGGEKIYPAEIERVLESHPAVRSALAYGIADEEHGQVPGASVDIGAAGTGAEEILRYARTRLARSHVPVRLRVVREPLRDDAGKARRRDQGA